MGIPEVIYWGRVPVLSGVDLVLYTKIFSFHPTLCIGVGERNYYSFQTNNNYSHHIINN